MRLGEPVSGASPANAPAAGDVEDFSALVGELYGGLLNEAPWDGFLQALAAHIDADNAILILLAPESQIPPAMTATGDPLGARRYVTDYFSRDPFKGLPEGRVTSLREFLAGSRIVETEFYREFMEFSGSDQILGIDLRAENGFEARLRVTRAAGVHDFGAAERASLQRLVPHLRSAITLFGRLQDTAIEQGVYRGAIEQLAVGTVLLDHRGGILRANTVAERIIAARDGLQATGGRLLIVGTPEASRSLQQLLRRLEQTADPATVPAIRLRVERPSGARDLSLVAKPALGPAYLRAGGGAAVALFISETAPAAAPASEAIRDFFKLTQREAALAAHIAGGASLQESARLLGVSYNTARTHLRAIFAKTGAARQSQLVLLLRRVTDIAGSPVGS
jgi:DNA-binding CsgD family transcriptional regulator